MNNMGIKLKQLIVISLSILIVACGSTPQPTIALTSNKLMTEDLKVGYVYIGPKDEATTHIFGASCLLCYGVASSLTSKLDGHLESTITTEELINIKNLVMSEYSARGSNISEVTLPTTIDKLKKFKGELGFAKKDFRSLKETLDVDVLVVLNIYRYGAYRSFSSYIPNGDPQGHVAGLLYTVDLNTNAYVQYLDLDEKVQPNSEWDEPSTFPSVTTSYYQAIENAKAKIRDAI
jgi:hypothetical protein